MLGALTDFEQQKLVKVTLLNRHFAETYTHSWHFVNGILPRRITVVYSGSCDFTDTVYRRPKSHKG